MQYASNTRQFCELKDAALAPMCENVVVPEVPLSANVRDGWFKLYLSEQDNPAAFHGDVLVDFAAVDC